jgi:hypothetical protein
MRTAGWSAPSRRRHHRVCSARAPGGDLRIVPTDGGNDEWNVYAAEAPSDAVDIKLSPEHDRYQWASPADAADMCLSRMVAQSLSVEKLRADRP